MPKRDGEVLGPVATSVWLGSDPLGWRRLEGRFLCHCFDHQEKKNQFGQLYNLLNVSPNNAKQSLFYHHGELQRGIGHVVCVLANYHTCAV
jgi:hypothetical protein